MINLAHNADVLSFDNQNVNQPVVNQAPATTPVACTKEAKLCPDGSAVGRQGPKCEFAPCSNIISENGVVITSLKPDDIVKLPITIEGYLDGTGWTANEGEIGNVQIFDANSKSVSNIEIIKTTTDWLKFPTYFKVIVGDREMMSNINTDTGFIKITSNGAKNDEQIKTFSIPIKFATPSADQTANWKTYRSESFEFKYPEKLQLVKNGNKVVLSHSIPYENSGDCDMTAAGQLYKTLDDFNISFEIVNQKLTLKNIDGQYSAGTLKGSLTTTLWELFFG